MLLLFFLGLLLLRLSVDQAWDVSFFFFCIGYGNSFAGGGLESRGRGEGGG